MTMSIKHREKPTDFSRQRKIGFKGILVSVLISLKRSLAVEIDNFINKLDVDGDIGYTKQAYSKARQNLKPSAYVELNDVVLEETYSGSFKTFKNYRLVAIDGSTVELPNTVEMREKYGVFNKKNANYPAAKICLAYDVLNEIILEGKLFSYKESEQAVAMELIPKLYNASVQDILIFDRGFPSVRLISLLNSLGKKYIFRVSKSFLKEVNEFTNSSDTDKTMTINITKRRISTHRIKDVTEPISFELRCARIELETEDEILVTNLDAEEIAIEELKYLYNKRWGIETNYNLLKNALEIENFTGDTDRAVQQDFYATIYICNVASMFIADAQEKYNQTSGNKKKKHEYKINKRIAMAHLKIDLLHVLLQDDPHKATMLYNKFVDRLSKHLVPIRHNRKYMRPIGHKPKHGRTNKKIL